MKDELFLLKCKRKKKVSADKNWDLTSQMNVAFDWLYCLYQRSRVVVFWLSRRWNNYCLLTFVKINFLWTCKVQTSQVEGAAVYPSHVHVSSYYQPFSGSILENFMMSRVILSTFLQPQLNCSWSGKRRRYFIYVCVWLCSNWTLVKLQYLSSTLLSLVLIMERLFGFTYEEKHC